LGRRVDVVTKDFSNLLRRLYAQLSRQESLDVDNPAAPVRQLYRLLLEPVREELSAAGVTTLLISADPGLQAVPYAALHDGKSYVGERYAFALTPSLGLMPLDAPANRTSGQQMAAGASRFEGLSPLPLVPQEVSQVASASKGQAASTYLNEQFTPQVLISKAGDSTVGQVHVATHAEFLPGGPSKAKLFTGTSAMSLTEFASLRQRREGAPLQLFVLSACRTALGDRDSELGFAGLALQAGSRSAIGSLWYVDDVATSAYFVQFYRYLDAGVPKAEAMQLVRLAMAQGNFRLEGDKLLGPYGVPVLEKLTAEQRRRVAQGLQHPFYWAGIELLGTPW
jgi:CHAT domain-containing protein